MKERKSPSIFGKVAFFGALLAMLVATVPHGTTEPWHKGMFAMAISGIGILRVVDGFVTADFRIAEPRLLVPLAGIILVALAQLVPISGGQPISLDPYETQSFIIVFGSLIVFVELLFNYTRGNDRLRQLVGVVLTIAIGSSLYGLLHHYIDSGQGFAAQGTEQSYAQFANRNHFALLAEMGIGLLIGVLLKGKVPYKWRIIGWIGFGILFYSIIAASSRGGLVSLTAMAILSVFFHVLTRSTLARSDRPQRSPGSKLLIRVATAVSLGIITFGIIVVLIASIGGDAVVTRIEQIDREIGSVEHSRVNRAGIWESTLNMIRDRPVLGSGFGAYGSAITKYDSANGRFLLEQSHNDYLQILADGGAVGAVLLLVFAVLVGIRMTNNLYSSDEFRRACCFGAMVGCVGVLIHSFVDFGLHVVVNAAVFATLIVIGTSRIEAAAGLPHRRRIINNPRSAGK